MKSGCFTALVGALCAFEFQSHRSTPKKSPPCQPSGRDSRLTYARETLALVGLYSNARPTAKPRALMVGRMIANSAITGRWRGN